MEHVLEVKPSPATTHESVHEFWRAHRRLIEVRTPLTYTVSVEQLREAKGHSEINSNSAVTRL